MNEPSEGHAPNALDAPRSRPVLSRPEPDETVEEFSARFLAEILHAHRLQEQADVDRD
jgi:hypothetical protein